MVPLHPLCASRWLSLLVATALLVILGSAERAEARPARRARRSARRPLLKATPGQRLCRRALRRIAHAARRGRKVCVVFDIDNTLVDTRHRTLAALRAFTQTDPALAGLTDPARARLARTPLSKVRYDGASTAAAIGLSGSQALGFDRFWQRFFWSPENFRHDVPIAQTTRLARQAKTAGAEVYYLTGRVAALGSETLTQLAALGLPDADAKHLLCKPAEGVRTDAFKRQELSRLRREGHRIAFFLSDAQSDLAAVADLRLPSVLVDFPVGPKDAPSLSPRTPRLHPRLHR